MAQASLVIRVFESDGITPYNGRDLVYSEYLEIKLEVVDRVVSATLCLSCIVTRPTVS